MTALFGESAEVLVVNTALLGRSCSAYLVTSKVLYEMEHSESLYKRALINDYLEYLETKIRYSTPESEEAE